MLFRVGAEADRCERIPEDLKLRIRESSYPESFGAKIYKITRDSQGERLSHMKITGGALKVKSVLSEWKTGRERRGHLAGKSQSDPYLFRGKIYDGFGSKSRNGLCGDRAYCDISRAGTGKRTGIRYASAGTGAVLSYRTSGRSTCTRHCCSFDSWRKKNHCYILYGTECLEKSMHRSWEKYRSRS